MFPNVVLLMQRLATGACRGNTTRRVFAPTCPEPPGSYQTVSGLAKRREIPLAWLVPVGIDGGLIGVVVLDLVLSWIGQPIGWLRQFVQVLTVGTVAANAAAGWPDLCPLGCISLRR